MPRPDGRTARQLRPITFLPDVAPHASGSVLIGFGNTRVICSCFIEEGVPRWMHQQNVKGGWLTAEYAMLPYSTLERKSRDISSGRLDGRSSEIQRLIGRSLRAAVDLSLLDGKTAWIDCDVLQADGGTRTASITGATVACEIAFQRLITQGRLTVSPLRKKVAAVSVGIFQGQPVLDLNYAEDSAATVDMNVVMTDDAQFVEIQGTGEEATFTREESNQLLDLAADGIKELIAKQEAVIAQAAPAPDPAAFNDLASFFRS